MWSWFKHGNLDTCDGDSIAEGIGQKRVTKNLEAVSVDEAYRVQDQTALTIIHHLLREEGLFVGLSTGINLAGAVCLARERGPGQVITTLLCDSGIRYMSKIFNREWLKERKLDPDLPIESVLD
jgi:cysteine synthase A